MKQMFIVSVFITILTLIDVYPIRSSYISPMLVAIWTLSWCVFAFTSLWSLFELLKITIRSPLKNLPILIILSVLFFTIIQQASVLKNINAESTLEISCTLDNLLSGKDSGLYQICHLGYPARQFFLPASISLAFGRGLFQLNFGNSIYVLIGLPIFALGLVRWFEKVGGSSSSSAIAIALLPQFYFFTHLIYLYEQSVYPIGFSLINVGLIALYLTSRVPIFAALIILLSLHIVHSYTPSLALIPLNISIFIILAIKQKKLKSFLPALVLLLCVGISFYSSYYYVHREDLRIVGGGTQDYLSDVQSFVDQIISHPQQISWISPTIVGLFILSIFLAPFFLGDVGLILSSWVVCVLVAGILVGGYSQWSLPERSFRSAVSIPIMAFLIANLIDRIPMRSIVRVGVFLLFLGLSIYSISVSSSSKISRGQAEFSIIVAQKIKEVGIQTPGVVYGVNIDLSQYKLDNINDILPYFTSNWRYTSVLKEKCRPNLIILGDDELDCTNQSHFSLK